MFEVTPGDLAALTAFRQGLYATFGLRRDALFDLLDARLATPGPASLVRHALAPPFRRRWPSACDALSDGAVDLAAVSDLWVRTLPPPAAGEREVWALDGTAWPRPYAATAPERTHERQPSPGKPAQRITPAWEWQWLVRVPAQAGSWILPLGVRRRGPAAGTPTELASAQLRAALASRPPGAPRPVVTLDSGYAPGPLAEAALGADLLVRLARKRTFHRPPGPYRGTGARPKHGPAFKVHDPTTWGEPDRVQVAQEARHGRVVLRVWRDLHEGAAPRHPFAVIRVEVERRGTGRQALGPLWLAWIGGPLPTDLLDVLHWYERRFTIEQGFRFGKQQLGWTAARPRQPDAAARWTALVGSVFWQLWLARPLVAAVRLPWERARAAPTPGQVQRALGGLLPALGSPARAPQVRGKAPGRPVGWRPAPHPATPTVWRPKRAGPCRCPAHRKRTAAAA